jgi:hypothetical protein
MSADWAKHPPAIYSVVTGFFPETSPKKTWATNPRPLLVCGTATDETTGTHFCRIAYGTTQKLEKAHDDDLVVANLSMMNRLGLKKPTRFLIHTGDQMVIMPWIADFFQPWTGYRSPVLSVLPDEMQRFVGFVLAKQKNLPVF